MHCVHGWAEKVYKFDIENLKGRDHWVNLGILKKICIIKINSAPRELVWLKKETN
jgi:hypothetical protein